MLCSPCNGLTIILQHIMNRPGFDAAFLLRRMLIKPTRYPLSSQRATRMALDRLEEYSSDWTVAQAQEPKRSPDAAAVGCEATNRGTTRSTWASLL
jgi:hypothetical protein